MRHLFVVLLSLFFLSYSDQLAAQHTAAEKEVPLIARKEVTFVVRKPDKAKNIAQRFHVSFKTLAKINRPLRKGQLLYAGKKITIPVWLKRKTANLVSSDFDIADYELNIDSLDGYIREDFISMADLQADTIRKIAIGKELKKIDKRITQLNQTLDSIQEYDMHNMSNREIRRMPMDRARRIGDFKLGTQVDSLEAVKKKITDERSKIDIRIADYEYLMENAAYNAAHVRDTDLKVITIQEPDEPKAKASLNKK